MTDTPNSKAFIKLPLDLLTSHAWRSLSLNGRRFVEFLMIEHMRHGGRANGKLLAPRRQLWDFGIGNHYVSDAIEECERAGVVKCQRGVGRCPNLYLLTWLPSCDGAAPVAPKWNGAAPVARKKMSADQHSLVVLNSTHKARSECRSALAKPKNKGIRSALTLKKLLTRRGRGLSDSDEQTKEALSCRWSVTNGGGVTICGKPTLPGQERCAEHAAGSAIH